MKFFFLSLFATLFLLLPAKTQESSDYNLYDDRITILELAECYGLIERKEQQTAMMEAWASALPVNVKSLSKKEFTTFFRQDEAVVRKKLRALVLVSKAALGDRCVELQTIVPPIIDKIQLLNQVKSQ